jgi:hypothetical protein
MSGFCRRRSASRPSRTAPICCSRRRTRASPGQRPVWLTNLTGRRWEELLELVVLQRSARVTVDCLNERFRYLGFSGRSYPGWHHHMTLVSAAYAYSRLARPALSVRPAARTA